jgi:hypothetical protein
MLSDNEAGKLATETMEVFKYLPEETYNKILDLFVKVVPVSSLIITIGAITVPRIALTQVIANAQKAQTSEP